MKKYIFNNQEYELEKNYKEVFDQESVIDKFTEYFDEYDYVLGDYSYDKLRMKGFYNQDNPKVKDMNNIEGLEDYLKNYCAYNCGYFLLKKVK